MILKGDPAVPVILASTVTPEWTPKKQSSEQAKYVWLCLMLGCFKGVIPLSWVINRRKSSICVVVISPSESLKNNLKFFVMTSGLRKLDSGSL